MSGGAYAATRSLPAAGVQTRSWEGFHGGWPMRIVEELAPRLPEGFVAEPRVHLGSFYEIDVCTFEQNEDFEPVFRSTPETNASIATTTEAPPVPR